VLVLSKMGKPKTLSLKDKLVVIEKSEKGLSGRKIAEDMKVGKTQIQRILQNKEALLKEAEAGVPLAKKRNMRKTGNEEVNELVWDWFKTCRSKRIPMSGPLVCEKAKVFAERLGVTTFAASNGWLQSFRNRHQIKFSSLSGESADVNPVVAQRLCSGRCLQHGRKWLLLPCAAV